MNDDIRDILASLYEQHSEELFADHRFLEDLLRFNANSFRKESNLLVASVKLNIPKTIAKTAGVVEEKLISRLVKRFERDFAVSADAGHWVVITWCCILGLDVPEDLMNPPRQPAPQQPDLVPPVVQTAPVVPDKENALQISSESLQSPVEILESTGSTEPANAQSSPHQSEAHSMLSSLLDRAEDDQQDPHPDITDPILNEIIRALLNNPYGSLDSPELEEITSLDIDGEGIKSLQGIQNLPNLTELMASRNSITDISPLRSLKKLRFVTLDLNSISDISPLAGCCELEHVSLRGNKIENIVPLLYNSNCGGIGSGGTVLLRKNPLSVDAVSIHAPILLARGISVIVS